MHADMVWVLHPAESFGRSGARFPCSQPFTRTQTSARWLLKLNSMWQLWVQKLVTCARQTSPRVSHDGWTCDVLTRASLKKSVSPKLTVLFVFGHPRAWIQSEMAGSVLHIMWHSCITRWCCSRSLFSRLSFGLRDYSKCHWLRGVATWGW